MKPHQQVLFVLRGADMALTTDQAFVKTADFTKFKVTQVVAVRKTGAFNTACLGGLYTAVAKGGNALVAAAQSYANLTGADKIVDATLEAINGTDIQSAVLLYLSLTIGNSIALTADIFVYGVMLD